jgi:hypothetical protein
MLYLLASRPKQPSKEADCRLNQIEKYLKLSDQRSIPIRFMSVTPKETTVTNDAARIVHIQDCQTMRPGTTRNRANTEGLKGCSCGSAACVNFAAVDLL